MKANLITAMSEWEHAVWCRGFNAGHAKARADTLAEVRATKVFKYGGEYVVFWDEVSDLLDRLSEGGEG